MSGVFAQLRFFVWLRAWLSLRRATLISRAGLLLVGLSVAGCSQMHWQQNRDDVIVRVGTYNKALPAKSHAGLFVPYAVMAAKAYENLDANGQSLGEVKTFGDQRTRAYEWLKGWDYVTGKFGPICADSKVNCSGVNGLEYQIWKHSSWPGGVCDEVALVLRGTDFRSLGDWLSNFHWILRLMPLNDQYDQIQSSTNVIIAKRIKTLACYRPGVTKIVAVGHSLGGGLAQNAAYMSKDISHVYAFDPSMVTGHYDTDVPPHAGKGLKIDRIYEHGEVLSYLRLLMRQVYAPSACNPQIRTVRFNLDTGNFIQQHSIEKLAANLIKVSGKVNNPQSKVRLEDASIADRIAEGCDSAPLSASR